MKILTLIISIAIAQFAGGIGSFFTVNSVSTWYTTITKPSFNPPSWIFGPVWITLYTFMGIASYLVWQARESYPGARIALIIYAVHLGFNALWSILFFGMKNPGLAFAEIIILWLMIVVVMVLFFKINKVAGGLFIPYLLWVSFASVLNFYIWRLNS